jgi:hypothetical protein
MTKTQLSFWNKRSPVVWIYTIFSIKQHLFGCGQEEGGEVNLGQKFIEQLWFYGFMKSWQCKRPGLRV